MFFDNILKKIKEEFGLDLSPEDLDQFKKMITLVLDNENMNQSIIFKTGCIVTTVSVKNYLELKKRIINGFKEWYETQKPPIFDIGFSYGKMTLCLYLNPEFRCDVTTDICPFYKNQLWGNCEVVYSSLKEDLEGWK